MNVGFTGTRRGMTPEQRRRVLHFILEALERADDRFLHGACVGADSEAASYAREIGLNVHAYPASDVLPENVQQPIVGEQHEAAPALERNRVIVDECDVLVAAPGGPERRRSGTWSAIRYAERADRRTALVWPDGTFEVRYGGRRKEER